MGRRSGSARGVSGRSRGGRSGTVDPLGESPAGEIVEDVKKRIPERSAYAENG